MESFQRDTTIEEVCRKFGGQSVASRISGECPQRFHLRLRDNLCAGIAFEDRQGRRPRGIHKDLGEFGEQDHQQGMDLIFVAHYVITKLDFIHITQQKRGSE